MKAICPNNEEHDIFVTVASATEEWVVNRDGSWRESLRIIDLLHAPRAENKWTCTYCGSQAIVTEDT